MPMAYLSEDDDPVVASYDVYITNPLPKEHEPSASPNDSSKLFVLQYPSYRPASNPYNAARAQKPVRLRLKPNTGMVEVEIPILTQHHFNSHAGEKYGEALTESRISQLGASHGLAGGFASAPVSMQNVSLNDIPAHSEQLSPMLRTQNLGGKIVVPCERDPIYMLGSFQNHELHLTHLDAVVQMRPQLHHIDAEEEINQKKFQPGIGPSGKMKAGFEAAPSKLESKAIELKMKDSKEDPKDRNLNANARMLRDIQADQWRSHEWIDEDEEEAKHKAATYTTLDLSQQMESLRHLTSVIKDDEWLDKISVPREDGKKGLRAKLKGRDRERARRKKVERQRKRPNQDGAQPVTRLDISSESDLSSASDQSDTEMAETGREEAIIKQEPDTILSGSAVEPAMSAAAPVGNTTKRRGRPKKA